jgi:hypothetical protein
VDTSVRARFTIASPRPNRGRRYNFQTFHHP